MAGELIRKSSFYFYVILHTTVVLVGIAIYLLNIYLCFPLSTIMVQVLDACSAPGNKTVHLAALMKGNGKIVACELDEKRVERLKYTVNLAGASSILG